jgi:phosphohistidine swiveling domain-containing protein
MAKFQFMRSLDSAIETIAMLGQKIGFDREKIAFMQLTEFLHLSTNSFDSAHSAYFRRTAEFREKRWQLTRSIKLPELITSPQEVVAFEVIKDKPNFVTHKSIRARVVWLDEQDPPYDLDGAIIAVRSADPGYDWIFSYALVGLITQYGGIGSHMSIRAAEFGLPAAIGCGETLFESLCGCEKIEIDGKRETVKQI